MDPNSDQPGGAAPQSQSHDQHQPACEWERSHPAHAPAPEQPGPPLYAPQPSHGPSEGSHMAVVGPGGAEPSGAEPANYEQDWQPVQQIGAAQQADDQPAAPQRPAEGSYEALAAFSGPVGTEMPGAGLHNDAKDQQPVQEPGSPAKDAPDRPGAHSTPGDGSQVQSEGVQAGMLKQEQPLLPQQADNAPAAEFPAHSTEPALPFHPEQSLQDLQHAADDKLMHDADHDAGTTQGMHAEAPDEPMTKSAQMPGSGGGRVQSVEPTASHEEPAGLADAEPQQSLPQQRGQPQSAPAVRTLDDIMSQFEGPPQPLSHPSSSPSPHQKPHTPVNGIPRQAQMHQEGAGGHDGQVHAGRDQEMPDAVEAATPPQAVAALPDGALLQGKGSVKGSAARRQEIKPETDAGSVVWAKTKGYPWWPAQVLAIEDPWIPPDMEIPRRGAVPVRFFGTYNFTWIESQRNLMAFDQGCQDDLPSKGNTKVFQDGLGEAQKYLDTGESPAGFSTMPTSPDVAPEEASAKPGKRPGSAKAREAGPGGPGISKDAGKMAAVRKKEAAARAAALQHRQRALKKLGLIPPRGSPYSEEPCLDVARTWFSQALVEESARQQRVQEQQRQLEERQKVQQALFQRQLAAQMLHQQQLLQRAAAQQAQQAQQGGQEAVPSVWHPTQGLAQALATSGAQQQQHQQQKAPEQYQAPEEGHQ